MRQHSRAAAGYGPSFARSNCSLARSYCFSSVSVHANNRRRSACTTPLPGADSLSRRSAGAVSPRRSSARASSNGPSSQAVTFLLARTDFHTCSARSTRPARHSRSTSHATARASPRVSRNTVSYSDTASDRPSRTRTRPSQYAASASLGAPSCRRASRIASARPGSAAAKSPRSQCSQPKAKDRSASRPAGGGAVERI